MLFVPDFELTGHGRDFNQCRMIAGAAVVINVQGLSKFVKRNDKGNLEFELFTKQTIETLIPKEHRFSA